MHVSPERRCADDRVIVSFHECLLPRAFEYESTNWATGRQAQGIDEFDDCVSAGSAVIVSNDGKHLESKGMIAV